MPDVIQEGGRIMTICNACRYCEGFCAVFPAMEQRQSFAEADMNYLANLCHNCTECLHACQYAEPHPFAVNVPRAMAQIRQRSYEKYCWPGSLGVAFRSHGVATVLALAGVMGALMLLVANRSGSPADFYAVIPHGVMVAIFGTVGLFVVFALNMGVRNYLRDTDPPPSGPRAIGRGLRDALTLRYLHGSGHDCTLRESVNTPWRRWFHHLTLYGFLFCTASTTVAAIYHALGRQAPYPLLSIPVILGAVGGAGLIVGSVGLWMLRQRRDPATIDPNQKGLDASFILALVLTSATGLLLLAVRDGAAMRPLLIVHLAFVLTLFLTLPYGKFVHALYRTAALIRYARESATAPRGEAS